MLKHTHTHMHTHTHTQIEETALIFSYVLRYCQSVSVKCLAAMIKIAVMSGGADVWIEHLF